MTISNPLMNQPEAPVEPPMKSDEVLQPEEIIEVLEKSHEPKRDPLEILIWAGLGLILVLLYAVLLTTHWFS